MDIVRRDVLEASLAAMLLSATRAHAAERPAPENSSPSVLWYDKPAATWVEANPVGNGNLGAMVFGQIKREHIQLNESSLWSGGPYRNVNPEARAALPKVRELIFAGRYAEAEAYADAHIQGTPMREMSYQSLGDLFIDLPDVNETSAGDYRRELDLDAAISRTRFSADGVTYVREVLASAVHGVLAISVRAEGGELAADLSFSTGLRATVSAEGGATLIVRGTNNADRGVEGKLRFAARMQIIPDGGTITADGPLLRIRGGGAMLILFAAATSYVGPDDVSGDPDGIVRDRLARAGQLSFSTLRDQHSADSQRLFRRVSLHLGASPAQPTDQRLEHAADRPDPSLAALYFQFARYLLISASRPGGQPASLQGIWNESNQPPWGSKYTININTQMNYWPVDTANLSECAEPLVAMVEQLAVSGARTAQAMYGARGWVAHHNTDLWRASGPVDHMRTGLWPSGGAWLCVQLWDHYDFHRDGAYLKRIYPLMRGAALFFLDTLVRDSGTGFMVTNPSLSPENDHGHGSTLCAGPTMDMQILRDLFTRTIAAAELLKTDAPFRRELAAMREKLAPSRIGKAGQLMEWQEDWDMTAPDIHHRHVSHCYGLYPSQQINPDDTPNLAAAVRKSLEIRGDDATGWGLGWRLNLWARLRDGAHAHKILIQLLSPGRTYPNMFDAHPPFQIDGNFGGAAGILEMLVQSRGELIDLIPALPPAWPSGSLRGVRVRGACTLDLSWQSGRIVEAVLHPEIAGKRIVRVGNRRAAVTLRAGKDFRITDTDFA
jgi:alpha-L-fucosidase 2